MNRKVGNAVQRNLLRRRMRAIVSERADDLPTGAYLVRSGPEGPALEFREFEGGHEPSDGEGDRAGSDGSARGPRGLEGTRGMNSNVDSPLTREDAPGEPGTTPGRPSRLIVGVVHGYQAARSGRPTGCRFIPSCSEYAVEAVERHGAARGSLLAVRRIARCTPWGGHGIDPVPDRRAP